MSQTRTGAYPILFRRSIFEFHQDLDSLIEWTKATGFAGFDLGKDGETATKVVLDAGLRVGSVDLAEWQPMISADASKRADAIARNAEYLRAVASIAGPMNHFVVMLPEDPALGPQANFGHMVESFGLLAPVFEETGARLIIEGWPGPGALCCTPEQCRALFREVSSPALGLNYDPSHLIRMHIDPLRFLREFLERVYHVHAKDTEILDERVYDLGTEVRALEAPGIAFGGSYWRYTIPGHGTFRWVEAFRTLAESGYTGFVSVELEDANFFRDTDKEKLGLQLSLSYLQGC